MSFHSSLVTFSCIFWEFIRSKEDCYACKMEAVSLKNAAIMSENTQTFHNSAHKTPKNMVLVSE